jgi:hypothetical protein
MPTLILLTQCFFAVPRKLKDDMKSWTQGGRVYEIVKPLVGMVVFGKTIQIMVIKSFDPSGKSATFYYYSPIHGLLGWEMNVGDAHEPLLILSQDLHGFGRQRGKEE